jgi:hypothetical protein
MPGYLLHTAATVTCPHQGPATTPPVQVRVLVGGLAVATTSSLTTVAGCAFTVPPGKPQPCVKVQWQSPSLRVKVMNTPVLVQASPGTGLALCQSAEQIPQGPPIVSAVQLRVRAL